LGYVNRATARASFSAVVPFGRRSGVPFQRRLTGAAWGRGCRFFRSGGRQPGSKACHRREVAARQDRRVDAGKRFL